MDVADDVARLARGAAAWANRCPSARAAVAIDTARTVARTSAAWAEAALGIKTAGGPEASPAVFAEETSTGPLATLRLVLITARALAETAGRGLPRLARAPQRLHAGGAIARIAVDVLPAVGPTGSLHDAAIFAGHRATVRCVDPGGVDAFFGAWREEVHCRPASGGVALVLGAGNVTGLSAADCLCQIFELGRAVFLKLHPLHAPLLPVFRDALAPLIQADLLVLSVGGPDVVATVLAESAVGHVHLTGGRTAFDAIVWGSSDRRGPPIIRQTITCELGNVTPWLIVPGRYTQRQLVRQADLVAASIINNTSFNCIATKVIVTARSWSQRDEFLGLIQRRLRSVQARPGWYPGAKSAWEAVTERQAPSDGTLPWVLRTDVDPLAQPQFVEREWFVPVAAEVPIDADSIDSFCVMVHDLIARFPGSLAASVTVPARMAPHDAARVELLIEHMPFGTVAVNTWSALAYAFGSAPWGGYPGATLADPKSGIGFVHDPLCLPLVHNTIVRGPLTSRLMPAWLPWHPHAASLARGLVGLYGSLACGNRGTWPLLKLLPAVLCGRE